MTTITRPQIAPLALAAQADLLLITVEMLRSPQTILNSPVEPWFNLPLGTLHDLLNTAFGTQLVPTESASIDGTEPIETPTLPEALTEVHELVNQLDADIWSDEYYRLFDSSQACALNQASYIRRDKGPVLAGYARVSIEFSVWPTRGWDVGLCRRMLPNWRIVHFYSYSATAYR